MQYLQITVNKYAQENLRHVQIIKYSIKSINKQ